MSRLLMSLLLLTLGSPCSAGSVKLADAARLPQYGVQYGNAPFAGTSASIIVAANDVRGMDFDIFIRLQKGMSEGELLLRAGKPDSEAVENIRDNIIKTYYYFPTSSHPWITTVTLRGGRIINLDRVKKTF